MKDQRAFWDNSAKKYAKQRISDPDAYQYTLGRMRSYLSRTDRVLELGCGTGSTALLMADGVKQFDARDLSENMIKIARRKASEQGVLNVNFTVSDAFDNRQMDQTYDAVMAMNLLHLVKDIPAGLKQVNVALKPGGLFFSKTFCARSAKSSIQVRAVLLILPIMQWIGKAPFVNTMSSQALEQAIIDAGFEVLEAGDYPADSRFVVARKTKSAKS